MFGFKRGPVCLGLWLASSICSTLISVARADPAESLGLGFEGRSSAGAMVASDSGEWSAVFYNPANLGLALQPVASFSGLGVFSYLNPDSAKTTRGTFIEVGGVMPLWPLHDIPVRVGLGVLTPSSGFYEIDIQPVDTPSYGLYNSRERRLSLSLGLGASIAPWLALGASVEMLPTVAADVDLDLANSMGPNTLLVHVGYRLNPILGVTILPMDNLRFALVWRGANRTWLDLPVKVDAEGVNLEAQIEAETFFVPHRITIGTRWDMVPGLYSELDVSWQQFSQMPHPSAKVALLDSNGEDTLGTKPPYSRTHDTVSGSVACGWDGPVGLRVGYRFRPDPFDDAKFRANLLSGDEHLLTLGARIPLWTVEESATLLEEVPVPDAVQRQGKGLFMTTALFGAYVQEKRQYKDEFLPENPGFPSIESGGIRLGFSIGVEARY